MLRLPNRTSNLTIDRHHLAHGQALNQHALATNTRADTELIQQGGTTFFDGHVEDGDGKAHYPIKFIIVWDGCPEPVEIIKTIN